METKREDIRQAFNQWLSNYYGKVEPYESFEAGVLYTEATQKEEYTHKECIRLRSLNIDLESENKRLKEEGEKREAALKEMISLTGLHPKVEDWAKTIQEQELIIYGLEEGSAEWQLKASDLTRDLAAKDRELSELREANIKLAEFNNKLHDSGYIMVEADFVKRRDDLSGALRFKVEELETERASNKALREALQEAERYFRKRGRGGKLAKRVSELVTAALSTSPVETKPE